MEKNGRRRFSAIDDRMLREMAAAAREFRRSRGGNRVAAIQRYVVALNRFNNVALHHLESGR